MDLDMRTHYRLEIIYNKYSPLVIGAIMFVYHVLSVLLPYNLIIFQYIATPSLLTTLHMYNSRKVFKLCKAHSCCVFYVLCSWFACVAEQFYLVPYLNFSWLAFILLGTLLFVLIAGSYYIKEHPNKFKNQWFNYNQQLGFS